MEIINIPINDLKPADYNPRQLTNEQHEHLKKSMEKFGLVDPIIVNGNENRKNVIVGGHQRVRIAKELGISEVPCVFVDLDEEKEKELNIRLNKNLGEWDFDLLANFDLEFLKNSGFDSLELDKYLGSDAIVREVEVDDLDTDNKCPRCGYEW